MADIAINGWAESSPGLFDVRARPAVRYLGRIRFYSNFSKSYRCSFLRYCESAEFKHLSMNPNTMACLILSSIMISKSVKKFRSCPWNMGGSWVHRTRGQCCWHQTYTQQDKECYLPSVGQNHCSPGQTTRKVHKFLHHDSFQWQILLVSRL